MNTLTKQIVYLPVEIEGASGNYIPDKSVLIVKEQGEMDKYWDALVTQQQAFVFTPEQLNEYTANVIKQALETAAEKAEVKVTENALSEDGSCYTTYDDGVISATSDKKSITNTFEETYQKLKV